MKAALKGRAFHSLRKKYDSRRFWEGPTSVGPLSRRKCVSALVPGVSSLRPRRLFPQPLKPRPSAELLMKPALLLLGAEQAHDLIDRILLLSCRRLLPLLSRQSA